MVAPGISSRPVFAYSAAFFADPGSGRSIAWHSFVPAAGSASTLARNSPYFFSTPFLSFSASGASAFSAFAGTTLRHRSSIRFGFLSAITQSYLAAGVFPVRRAQPALEDLARVLAREFQVEVDFPGDFVSCDSSLEERLNVGRSEVRPWIELHRGTEGFAEFLIGDAEDGAIAHAGHQG